MKSDVRLVHSKYNKSDEAPSLQSYWYNIPNTTTTLEIFQWAEKLGPEEVIDMLLEAQNEIAQLLQIHQRQERLPPLGWDFQYADLLVFVVEKLENEGEGPFLTYGLLEIVVGGLLEFFPAMRGGRYNSIRFRVFEEYDTAGLQRVAVGLLGPFRADTTTS